MHVHIQAIGGVSGDMFVAAACGAVGGMKAHLDETLAQIGPLPGVHIRYSDIDRGDASGGRFMVEAPRVGHQHYADIVEFIRSSGLSNPVRDRALDIFRLLGEAESQVHGLPLSEVHFHEVGNWDSVVDIIFAAAIIEKLDADLWSTGPLPMGEGFVDCDHGRLPVPAPAALLLLQGLPLFTDGIKGERITPTGAAILRHLQPKYLASLPPMRLAAVGVGVGARKLDGVSNILRLLLLHDLGTDLSADTVGVIRFDVDDQSAEDLAIALDYIRAVDGVLDVVQLPVYGKKGRIAARVEVLTAPGACNIVATKCLEETTTIGLRWSFENRIVLAREERKVSVSDASLRVKVVQRPAGGRTAKLEASELEGHSGHASRKELRDLAERTALNEDGNEPR